MRMRCTEVSSRLFRFSLRQCQWATVVIIKTVRHRATVVIIKKVSQKKKKLQIKQTWLQWAPWNVVILASTTTVKLDGPPSLPRQRPWRQRIRRGFWCVPLFLMLFFPVLTSIIKLHVKYFVQYGSAYNLHYMTSDKANRHHMNVSNFHFGFHKVKYMYREIYKSL